MRHRSRTPYRHAFVLAVITTLLSSLAALPLPDRVDLTTVVTGTIRDAAGQGIAGAAIDVRGRRARTTSGDGGRFARSVARTAVEEAVTLRARRIGYAQDDVHLILRGDTVRVDITLVPSGVALSEVMTMGSAAVSPARDDARSAIRRPREPANTEGYDHIVENEFRSPRNAPLSTFSADVDRASYTNVRRYLSHGTLPPADAVRIEELINYFPYGDPAPRAGDAPLRITTEIAPAPWNAHHDLVRIALRARDVDMRHAPASNLVFLVDVSGSMMGPGRLPLVKESLALLVNQMRAEDRIAIVVYAGRAGLVLPSTSGGEKQQILETLDRLEAGGSTAGGAGIRLAYDVARQHFIRGGNNRVILCTDGDFNVGASSDGEMVRLIEQRRAEGSYLTILGFGMGNYKDGKMEQLAGAGNGNYGYIDGLLEARSPSRRT
jgi:Ca-activated chloride channel family protein